MTAKLWFEGFMVRPIIHLMDEETSETEAYPVGEQKVKLADAISFFEETWPELWDQIRKNYEAAQMHNEALALVEAEATGNRATKRAAKKVAAKKPGAAKLASIPSPKPGELPKRRTGRMVPPTHA